MKINEYEVLFLAEHPEWTERAARWYHEKWGIPESAYLESIGRCQKKLAPVPQWYLVLDGDEIAAGIGAIENDFHLRPELTPNVCAVYVEKPYRNQGIAGKMLALVCDEFSKMGIDTLYLLTDHTSFYERYNWEFLCMVTEKGGQSTGRMYIHKNK